MIETIILFYFLLNIICMFIWIIRKPKGIYVENGKLIMLLAGFPIFALIAFSIIALKLMDLLGIDWEWDCFES